MANTLDWLHFWADPASLASFTHRPAAWPPSSSSQGVAVARWMMLTPYRRRVHNWVGTYPVPLSRWVYTVLYLGNVAGHDHAHAQLSARWLTSWDDPRERNGAE